MSMHEFHFLSISPPHLAGGEGEGWVAVWCRVAGCKIKPRHFFRLVISLRILLFFLY